MKDHSSEVRKVERSWSINTKHRCASREKILRTLDRFVVDVFLSRSTNHIRTLLSNERVRWSPMLRYSSHHFSDHLRRRRCMRITFLTSRNDSNSSMENEHRIESSVTLPSCMPDVWHMPQRIKKSSLVFWVTYSQNKSMISIRTGNERCSWRLSGNIYRLDMRRYISSKGMSTLSIMKSYSIFFELGKRWTSQ